MARLHTKCTACSDELWFEDDDPIPQVVVCSCRTTRLLETGPTGSFEDLTNDEVADLSSGIRRPDMIEMRSIMDDNETARPRHCFRWNNTLQRWELSEVAPADRTLLAYRISGDVSWTDV